jgi:hypothetical protein
MEFEHRYIVVAHGKICETNVGSHQSVEDSGSRATILFSVCAICVFHKVLWTYTVSYN